jgi:hypothetical protein
MVIRFTPAFVRRTHLTFAIVRLDRMVVRKRNYSLARL